MLGEGAPPHSHMHLSPTLSTSLAFATSSDHLFALELEAAAAAAAAAGRCGGGAGGHLSQGPVGEPAAGPGDCCDGWAGSVDGWILSDAWA